MSPSSATPAILWHDYWQASSALDAGLRPRNLSDLQILISAEKVSARQERAKAVAYPDQLPILALKEEFLAALAEHQVVIVTAETGSGKSTQLPKMLMEAQYGARGLIGVTQPRRIAATSIARKLANDLHGSLGDQIGYKVRFDKQAQAHNLIQIMTDGVLIEELKRDPYLTSYSVLMLDEIHERSVNIDLLLGVLRPILNARKELRLVLSSASVSSDALATYFNLAKNDAGLWAFDPNGEKKAPVLSQNIRLFPIKIEHWPLLVEKPPPPLALGKSPRDKRSFPKKEPKYRDDLGCLLEKLPDLLTEIALDTPSGNILVFLPTAQSIEQAKEDLEEQLDKQRWELVPLYGRMSLAEQNQIYALGTRQKIVLATNLAETSLTVPDISCVVDSGLARVSRFNALNLWLPVEKIAKANIQQRIGRAGRTRPGRAILLYSAADHQDRPEYQKPELLRSDLAHLYLQVLNLGFADLEGITWLDAPSTKSMQRAVQKLNDLGAVDEALHLTPLGRRLLTLQLPIALAAALLKSRHYRCSAVMIPIVSALNIPGLFPVPIRQLEERPAEWQSLLNLRSEPISYFNIWFSLFEHADLRSKPMLRKLCQRYNLSFPKILEWVDTVVDLRKRCQQMNWPVETLVYPLPPVTRKFIHMSLLGSFLRQVIFPHPEKHKVYLSLNRKEGFLAKDSLLSNQKAPWLLSLQFLETHALFYYQLMVIEPRWILKQGEKFVRTLVTEVFYDKIADQVTARINKTFFGLLLVENYSVDYSQIDRESANRTFIQEYLLQPLVEHEFAVINLHWLMRMQGLIHSFNLDAPLPTEEILVTFYRKKLRFPCSKKELLRQMPLDTRQLLLQKEDWPFPMPQHWNIPNIYALFQNPGTPESRIRMASNTQAVLSELLAGLSELFPDGLWIDGEYCPLEYNFANNEKQFTLRISLSAHAEQCLNSWTADFIVPGLVLIAFDQLLSALAKKMKTHFSPYLQTFARLVFEANKAYQASLDKPAANINFRSICERVLLTTFPHLDLYAVLQNLNWLEFRPFAIEKALGRAGNEGKTEFQAEQELEGLNNAFPLLQAKKSHLPSAIPVWYYSGLKLEGDKRFPRFVSGNYLTKKFSIIGSLPAIIAASQALFSKDLAFWAHDWEKDWASFKKLQTYANLLLDKAGVPAPKSIEQPTAGAIANPVLKAIRSQKTPFQSKSNGEIAWQTATQSFQSFEKVRKTYPVFIQPKGNEQNGSGKVEKRTIQPPRAQNLTLDHLLAWYEQIYLQPTEWKNWGAKDWDGFQTAGRMSIELQAPQWPVKLVEQLENLWQIVGYTEKISQSLARNGLIQIKTNSTFYDSSFSLFFIFPTSPLEEFFGLSNAMFGRLKVYKEVYAKIVSRLELDPDFILNNLEQMRPWGELWWQIISHWQKLSDPTKVLAKEFWFHWEELKVSIFSQALKPAMKISFERMQKMDWLSIIPIDTYGKSV